MPEDGIARQIAERLQGASWIREMFERGLRLKQQLGADQVFDFSLGNPSNPPPDSFFEALQQVANDRDPEKHRYMPNAGFPEARQAIASYVRDEYAYPIADDGVILTSGAAGGLNVALNTVCEPGDEVIVLAPFFPEYRFYIEQAGAKLVLVDTDEAFQPDPQALASAITARTRVVMLNSPNNPTGVVYTPEKLRALTDALEARDSDSNPIYLLQDDPYRRVVFDGEKPAAPGSWYPRTILVSSFSKDVSIAGERAGFIAVADALPNRKRVLEGLTMLNRTLGFVNMNATTQRVLAHCAGALSDVDAYRRNRDLMCGALTKLGYELTRPGGAMFVFPKTPIPDEIEFIEILSRYNILAVPGRGFGRAGHIRLSFAVDPKVIERSLPGFEKALADCRTVSGGA